jgi:two-component system, chemotaxis family, chemotaxis protein CheY
MQQQTARSLDSGPAAAATPSILVVEDDAATRTLLRRMLERTGFAVTTAINGRDGVERFREHPADVVLTDMLMPEMDGIDLIRTLRSEWPAVRVIAVSGFEHPYLGMALGYGAKATLNKPVHASQLVETVKRVLAA